MIETLLWLIFSELTVALVLGGYVLREIQTALAVIVLHECAEPPPAVTVIEAPTLNEAPVTVNEKETIGTFGGPSAWN